MAKEFYPSSVSVAMKGAFCVCLVVLFPWLVIVYFEFQEEWYQAIIYVKMTGSHADSTVRIAFSPSDGYKLCSQGVITEKESWLCLMAALKPVDSTLGIKGGKLRSALSVFKASYISQASLVSQLRGRFVCRNICISHIFFLTSQHRQTFALKH